ncbi:restriction endonuclease [uncultured Shewanella sp.]|uniref:nSTAND3 domain-containing NTPase n=1 Tax=uncultured Shewanella sp. TaxID=173975 RepID=UPI002608BA8A|nr:restriction endonuclease [uncultured Shewanella sp.]
MKSSWFECGSNNGTLESFYSAPVINLDFYLDSTLKYNGPTYMNDYDFSTLNDKDFEILSTDILSIKEGVAVDRFKPGKDQGIDGKFFSIEGEEVIIQVKHWITSGIEKLLNQCRNKEVEKVRKLNPSRYIFVCSLPLSNSNKEALTAIFSPYLNQSDIYGKENLNDHLREPEYSHIEKNHYKLWLSSSNVLSLLINSGIYSKSEKTFEDIKNNCKYYVKTESHDKARHILNNSKCLIVTGEPGAGKTTLAENLCYLFVLEGFEFVEIEDSIDNAWDVFTKDKKQLFYFDDFLGRNYLDGLYKKEDSKIIKFMKAVKSCKDKMFILTSRSTILNQGKQKSELFEIANIQKNEFELNINKLTEIEKAKILYNHMYFSNLPLEFIDKFYDRKAYRSIISHKNFNPRLMSFITDIQRYDDLNKDQYWEKVESQIRNPKDIWEFVFDNQTNEMQKLVIDFIVINNRRINENNLLETYKTYCKLTKQKTNLREFRNSLKILTGSLLNRYLDDINTIEYDLFNPSIADYTLPIVSNDNEHLALIIVSLNNNTSFNALLSLEKNKLVNKKSLTQIINYIADEIDKIIKNIINKKETNECWNKYFELYTKALLYIKNESNSKKLV